MSDKELIEWLYLAEGDKETADLLYEEDGRPEIIIYHYHQALEKYFKYILLLNKEKINKVHSVDKLLSDILRKDNSFSVCKNDVLLINSYLPKLRYPYGDRLTLDDVNSVKESFTKTFRLIQPFLKKVK
ncbi:MAG: hypothetical protein A2Y40_07765 [Candidatus Margulisbacteria bacterium GWF2_35_9]|nr:MAG: hypothetical protein A2Y40_07765 [Candidatus Margulisbacteria bacterium GWF2_35_9]